MGPVDPAGWAALWGFVLGYAVVMFLVVPVASAAAAVYGVKLPARRRFVTAMWIGLASSSLPFTAYVFLVFGVHPVIAMAVISYDPLPTLLLPLVFQVCVPILLVVLMWRRRSRNAPAPGVTSEAAPEAAGPQERA